MKNLLSVILLTFVSSIGCFAADRDVVRLQFPSGVSLEDVLSLYSHLTKRRIWVALGVHATVSVASAEDLSVLEALKLIRTNLLEQHGIELKDSDTGETFVSWSDNPKYLHLATPNLKPFGQNPALPTPSKK